VDRSRPPGDARPLREPQLADRQRAGLSVLTGLSRMQLPWSFVDARPTQPDVRSGRKILLVILAVQALLSIRLVWANTAFQDEALYIWGGRLELAHLLHGAPVPGFQTYFSGAPVVYPVLAGLADELGGLATVRLLSLVLMLGATVLCYATGRRLYSRRAGLFAAGLFAGTGAAQFLGAFATYDALAILLLASATWLGVRSAWCQATAARITLLVLAGLILSAADAAKYAATLFDPVVVAVIALAAWRERRLRAGLLAGALVTAVTWGALDAALNLGGYSYWSGILLTTLSRPVGTSTSAGILYDSVGWVGIVMLLAIIGAIVAAFYYPGRAMRLLGVVLAGAIFLAPAEQARIHVFTSLFKHVGFGAWFGAMVAGYAITSLASAVPAHNGERAVRLGSIAVALCAVLGLTLAGTHFAEWPNSTAFDTRLGSLIASHPGPDLLENESVPAYYLGSEVAWQTLSDTSFFTFTDPDTGATLTGQPAYATAIKHAYFAVIALAGSSATDQAVSRDLAGDRSYRLMADLPFTTSSYHNSYRIWVRMTRGPEQ
jgi:Dolichyl-phosphate-mannose-protein mannosyltransferase